MAADRPGAVDSKEDAGEWRLLEQAHHLVRPLADHLVQLGRNSPEDRSRTGRNLYQRFIELARVTSICNDTYLPDSGQE